MATWALVVSDPPLFHDLERVTAIGKLGYQYLCDVSLPIPCKPSYELFPGVKKTKNSCSLHTLNLATSGSQTFLYSEYASMFQRTLRQDYYATVLRDCVPQQTLRPSPFMGNYPSHGKAPFIVLCCDINRSVRELTVPKVDYP